VLDQFPFCIFFFFVTFIESTNAFPLRALSTALLFGSFDLWLNDHF